MTINRPTTDAERRTMRNDGIICTLCLYLGLNHRGDHLVPQDSIRADRLGYRQPKPEPEPEPEPPVRVSAKVINEFAVKHRYGTLWLTHMVCGEGVCQVEADDELAVLILVCSKHTCDPSPTILPD